MELFRASPSVASRLLNKKAPKKDSYHTTPSEVKSDVVQVSRPVGPLNQSMDACCSCGHLANTPAAAHPLMLPALSSTLGWRWAGAGLRLHVLRRHNPAQYCFGG